VATFDAAAKELPVTADAEGAVEAGGARRRGPARGCDRLVWSCDRGGGRRGFTV